MTLTGLAVHGLPLGFEEGCRSAGGCPNHGTELLVCRDAWSRYRSDFSFKKRVDRGLTAVEILEEERAEVEASRPVVLAAQRKAAERAEKVRLAAVDRERVKAERAAAREQESADRALAKADVRAASKRPVVVPVARVVASRVMLDVKGARAALRAARAVVAGAQEALREAVRGQVAAEVEVERLLAERARRREVRVRVPKPREVKPHGTNAAWARGCRCEPCGEAHRAYHREYWRKRRLAAVPAEYHGTPYGYGLGCKRRDECPAVPTCADASLAEENRRRREAGIPEQVEMVDAGPVREHVAAVMASGVALLSIAERSGVSKSVLKNMVYGRSGARQGEKSGSVSVVNAERILAVVSGNPREKEVR